MRYACMTCGLEFATAEQRGSHWQVNHQPQQVAEAKYWERRNEAQQQEANRVFLQAIVVERARRFWDNETDHTAAIYQIEEEP